MYSTDVAELTEEEIKQHRQHLANIRRRVSRVVNRYNNGEITRRAFCEKFLGLEEEERLYLQDCGIFSFYGKLFRRMK